MIRKPILGIIGVSDGDPEVHETLKGFVQAQVDTIVNQLRKDGRVDVIEAECLVNSVESAKEQAELLKNKGVDGTVISHGVFAYPNFSAIIAKNGRTG